MRRAFRILPWGVFLLFAGIIVVIIGGDMLHEKLIESVGVISILLGVLIGGLAFLQPALFETPAKARREKELPAAPRAALPAEREVVEMPGVTEVTTKNLADRERR